MHARNPKKTNETKRNETKRNETKRNGTERNETEQNETEPPVYQNNKIWLVDDESQGAGKGDSDGPPNSGDTKKRGGGKRHARRNGWTAHTNVDDGRSRPNCERKLKVNRERQAAPKKQNRIARRNSQTIGRRMDDESRPKKRDRQTDRGDWRVVRVWRWARNKSARPKSFRWSTCLVYTRPCFGVGARIRAFVCVRVCARVGVYSRANVCGRDFLQLPAFDPSQAQIAFQVSNRAAAVRAPRRYQLVFRFESDVKSRRDSDVRHSLDSSSYRPARPAHDGQHAFVLVAASNDATGQSLVEKCIRAKNYKLRRRPVNSLVAPNQNASVSILINDTIII